MEKIWKEELYGKRGLIYTPDGRWVQPTRPLLRKWDGDVWCDSKEEIELPEYELCFARFIESVVASRDCGSSGTVRFNFVLQNVGKPRATGDLFNWKELYIDRETRAKRPEDERTICEAFGIAGRRTMNRLKDRIDYPRENILQDRLLERMCWFSISRKVFLARAGYPEFCEPYAS